MIKPKSVDEITNYLLRTKPPRVEVTLDHYVINSELKLASPVCRYDIADENTKFEFLFPRRKVFPSQISRADYLLLKLLSYVPGMRSQFPSAYLSREEAELKLKQQSSRLRSEGIEVTLNLP
ncbi:hypothetical protein HN587_02590 [Candidatus Woesearchaeota archaeon]|jgi:hypothetical protein|nr:hypothetical protein [Candidatus Woesearchaeota archaeon]